MVIEKNCTNVLYDGSCPMCALEIKQYKKSRQTHPSIGWMSRALNSHPLRVRPRRL